MTAARWTAMALVVMMGMVAREAAAQRRRPPEPPYERAEQYRERGPAAYVGLGFFGMEPRGDFAFLVDDGWGGQLEGSFPVVRSGALRLRLDVGLVSYGHEHRDVCFGPPVGCRISLDLTTDNMIFFAGAGPELALPGRVSPYVNASVGFSYFSTFSSLKGDRDAEPFATTEHFDDFVPASRLGGGLRLQLKGGRTPLFVDVGAQYHRNGVAEYLVEGDIVDNADGSISIFPNRTEANLVTYQVGFSVGIPRRGERDRGYRGGRDRGWRGHR